MKFMPNSISSYFVIGLQILLPVLLMLPAFSLGRRRPIDPKPKFAAQNMEFLSFKVI